MPTKYVGTQDETYTTQNSLQTSKIVGDPLEVPPAEINREKGSPLKTQLQAVLNCPFPHFTLTHYISYTFLKNFKEFSNSFMIQTLIKLLGLLL